MGLTGKRCESDERLLSLYRCYGDPVLASRVDTPKSSAVTESPLELYIVDCRAKIAALGNQTQGKGVENTAHYVNSTLMSVTLVSPPTSQRATARPIPLATS